MIVALRKARRHLRHDARAGRGARRRRRDDRRRHARRAAPPRGAVRAGRSPLPLTPSHRLEARLSELAGAPVELERPNDPRTATTRRTWRCSSRPSQRRSPRELAEELAAAAAGLDEVERAEVAGPGFVNLWLSPAWFGEALGEILAAGPRLRRRLGGSRRRTCRSRWSPPTRPGRSRSPRRGTARTATRSRGCSSSPATRSSASTTTTTPARRWSGSAPRSRRAGAGRSRPRTATAASTSTSSRRADERSGAADARADRGDARALPHPLRLVGAAEPARAAAAGVPAAARHLREGRRRLGAVVGVRRRRRPRADPLARAGRRRRPTARPTSSTSSTSSSAASTGRSTCSAPTTTARATGTRRSRGCSATTPTASRCCSTSSST